MEMCNIFLGSSVVCRASALWLIKLWSPQQPSRNRRNYIFTFIYSGSLHPEIKWEPAPLLSHTAAPGQLLQRVKGRKGCLFLKMPFTIQAPSTWFYSAASYTRHQTSPELLCAESFPCGESCLDPPCVFQSISPVRHTDKLKQADFHRAQKEDGGESARSRRAASPCSPPFPVEIGKVAAFPDLGMEIFFPIGTHQPQHKDPVPGKEEDTCPTDGGVGR